MLLGGTRRESIRIKTPAGIPFAAEVLDINIKENAASCAVRKRSGDDPDVTDGALIYARAGLLADENGEIAIEGGEGVGVVTRPGLDQPVGSAAINSVPREMIRREVREVMALFDCRHSVRIVISVPEGREMAEKTFNHRLGIEGGISIIGTTGIVEPMSTKALLDTIRVEIRQRRAMKEEVLVIAPGNYGLRFLKEAYGYDLDRAVKCSNFIGETLDMAGELGFRKVLLLGHVGKLIKVSGGIMNTHSREADARMELMAAAAVRAGAGKETVLAVLDSVNTEEACGHLAEAGIVEACFSHIMERISYYLNKRAAEGMNVECLVYSNEWGLLGKTPGAEAYLKGEKGCSMQAGGLPGKTPETQDYPGGG